MNHWHLECNHAQSVCSPPIGASSTTFVRPSALNDSTTFRHSIGPQGIADIRPIPKRRKFRLSKDCAPDIRRACQRVGEMMGVTKITAESGCLLLEYDLRQTILSQIEAVAAAEDLKFKQGVHGLRRCLWKYLEGSELEYAAHPATGACCNRPPMTFR